MGLSCPRCSVPMTGRSVTPREAEGSVTIDVCDRCRGVWLDHDELDGLCPSVSDLPSRRQEIELLAAARLRSPDPPPAPPPQCPRCAAPTLVVFAVVDVDVDFCRRCAGVWLDGDEAAELMVSPEEEGGRRRAKNERGAYRASALRAVRKGVIDCKACGAASRIEQAFVRDDGLVCTLCHVGAVEEALQERAATGAILRALLRAIDGLAQKGWLPGRAASSAR